MAAEGINVNMTSYSSAKAAVNHLTRNMAFELGLKGICINAIALGATMTQALETVLIPEIKNELIPKLEICFLGLVFRIINQS